MFGLHATNMNNNQNKCEKNLESGTTQVRKAWPKTNMSFGSTQGVDTTMEDTGSRPRARFAREACGGLGPNISIDL